MVLHNRACLPLQNWNNTKKEKSEKFNTDILTLQFLLCRKYKPPDHYWFEIRQSEGSEPAQILTNFNQNVTPLKVNPQIFWFWPQCCLLQEYVLSHQQVSELREAALWNVGQSCDKNGSKDFFILKVFMRSEKLKDLFNCNNNITFEFRAVADLLKLISK